MTDSSTHLDAVAEAIWRAGWPEESAGRTWNDCIYRRYYRHMAQAAIDSLQLTQAWNIRTDMGVMAHASLTEHRARQLAERWDDMDAVSHLVSPWVVMP